MTARKEPNKHDISPHRLCWWKQFEFAFLVARHGPNHHCIVWITHLVFLMSSSDDVKALMHQWEYIVVDNDPSYCFDSDRRFHCFPIKNTEGVRSEHVGRPRFRNGSDAFLTPSSTPKTPSSWPPRPALTVLRQTCVAGRVMSFLPFLFAFQQKQNHHQSLNYLCVMSFCLEGRVLLFGIFQNSRPEMTRKHNWSDELCNGVYKFWNEV